MNVVDEIDRDCKRCGWDEFSEILQRGEDRVETIVECGDCGGQGKVFSGDGATIYSGVLRG